MIDMRFARPEFLFCLLLIPLLIVFFVKAFREKRAAINQFGEMPLISAVSLMPSVKRQVIKTVFCILSLILIIISLAQPQSGTTDEKVKGGSIDIVFAIDTSLSMLAMDVKPSRLEAAKEEVYNLLNSLKGERVGIVAFSGTALALCPLTADYNVTRYFLDTLDSDTVITLGTSLGDAIEAASRLFDALDLFQGSRVKTVVFLSDGEEHETDLSGLEKIANKTKADGIRVFALGVGTTIGSYIPVFDEKSKAIIYKKDKQGGLISSNLEELTLQKICSLTEGRYYQFSPLERRLERIYADILKISKKIPKTKQPQKVSMTYKDIFQYSISLALIFFLLRILIPERVGARRAIPLQGAIIIPMMLTTFLALGWGPWNPVASRIKEGNSLFNQGKYEDAFLKYKEAQQYAPGQPVINFNIGNIHYLTESYNKALEEFDAAIINSDDKTLQANAFFNRGSTEYRLGLLDEAAQSYKRALELNPSDQDAKYNLELVKREILKRKKKEKEKPPTPSDKEEKKEEKEKGAEEKEMQPAGGLTGEQKPKGEAPPDKEKEKMPSKEPKAFTPEQAFDFLKAHKPREQEEQKISGWFRLRKKHLEKDW